MYRFKKKSAISTCYALYECTKGSYEAKFLWRVIAINSQNPSASASSRHAYGGEPS